ncbi:MAG: hypothetical protein GKR99_02165 [Rhodobacteraceae bacterium]|nr:hypothetical protein [Paracoccaceae bacterium]
MIHPPKQDESQIRSQGNPSRFRFKPKRFRLKKPLTGPRLATKISQQEKALLLEISDATLFSEVSEVESAVHSLNDLLDRHEKAFVKFSESLITQGANVDGRVISGHFTIKQTDLIGLSDLEGHIRSLVTDARTHSDETLGRVSKMMRENFGKSFEYAPDITRTGSRQTLNNNG